MDFVIEWATYMGRWAHVIAAITWIGTSFYFNWLDLSERPPKAPTLKPDVVGEVHEMHGGSFYYHERYWPAEDNARTLAHSGPAQLTFLTGFFLIVLIYWLAADVYLTGGQAVVLSPWLAIPLSAAILFAPWLVYDAICRATADERVVVAVMALVALAVSYGATQVFGGRAAFVHVGAMMGTAMVANVQYHIIPNHIRMRKQVQAGERVDQGFHKLAKRRSQHNNYFTLPVVFAMLAAHFPLVTANDWSWAILMLMMGAGFALRHRRNVQLASDRVRNGWAVLAALLVAASVALSAVPPGGARQDMADLGAADAAVFKIVETRCTVCHAASPTMDGFAAPPAGVRFETLDQIRAQAAAIRSQAIDSDIMPPGNMTDMTPAERAELAAWLDAPQEE